MDSEVKWWRAQWGGSMPKVAVWHAARLVSMRASSRGETEMGGGAAVHLPLRTSVGQQNSSPRRRFLAAFLTTPSPRSPRSQPRLHPHEQRGLGCDDGNQQAGTREPVPFSQFSQARVLTGQLPFRRGST